MWNLCYKFIPVFEICIVKPLLKNVFNFDTFDDNNDDNCQKIGGKYSTSCELLLVRLPGSCKRLQNRLIWQVGNVWPFILQNIKQVLMMRSGYVFVALLLLCQSYFGYLMCHQRSFHFIQSEIYFHSDFTNIWFNKT